MARRKKTKYRSKRRRMGAIGGADMITSALGIVAGAVAGKFVANKLLPNVNSKIKNAGVVVIGAMLPKFVKSNIGKAVGNGMIAAGGVGLVSELLPGIGAMDDSIEFPVTVGEVPDNLSVIAGDGDVMAGDDLSVLSGIEETDEEGEY